MKIEKLHELEIAFDEIREDENVTDEAISYMRKALKQVSSYPWTDSECWFIHGAAVILAKDPSKARVNFPNDLYLQRFHRTALALVSFQQFN